MSLIYIGVFAYLSYIARGLGCVEGMIWVLCRGRGEVAGQDRMV